MHGVLEKILFLKVLFISTFVVGFFAKRIVNNREILYAILSGAAGLLLSTGFFIAIPEGVEFLNKGSREPAQHAKVSGKTVGLYIGLGFLVIFILDQITSIIQDLFTSCSDASNMSKNKIVEHYRQAVEKTNERDGLIATVGLSIHSIIDGFTIGTFMVANKSSSMMIALVALIIHKLPTSFSLSTFLVSKGVSRYREIIYSLVFSLSTPISAFITSMILSVNNETPSHNQASGKLLLVSSGTFLYTATVHVFTEAFGTHETLKSKISHMDSEECLSLTLSRPLKEKYSTTSSPREKQFLEPSKTNYLNALPLMKFLAFVTAFLIPLLTTELFGNAH